MNGDDWAAVSAIGTGVGVLISAGAVAYTRTANKRSKAAEARAAKAEARAEELARVASQQEHDRLAPARPAALLGEPDPGGSLYVTITASRDYRIRALAYLRDGRMVELGPEPRLRAGVPTRFPIENYQGGTLATEYVLVKFWPPSEDDGPKGLELWSCRCGRPLRESDDGSVRTTSAWHWQWRVPVVYNDPANMVHGFTDEDLSGHRANDNDDEWG